ncbi:MAG: prefoldin subunit [Nanoarchaeota archaeon]|nr:prefoldin subunit [Nanoarchaeota archaeon]MBU1104135.1 prefoldin subunit [Nanoarchaeota archaeon]
MDFDKETSERIGELQVLEGHLQSFMAQKQGVQIEFNEVNNAIEELKKSGEEVYKVVSGFMFKSTKEKLNAELGEKKKFLEMKIESMEKQEMLIEKDAEKLRGEINKIVSKAKK